MVHPTSMRSWCNRHNTLCEQNAQFWMPK